MVKPCDLREDQEHTVVRVVARGTPAALATRWCVLRWCAGCLNSLCQAGVELRGALAEEMIDAENDHRRKQKKLREEEERRLAQKRKAKADKDAKQEVTMGISTCDDGAIRSDTGAVQRRARCIGGRTGQDS